VRECLGLGVANIVTGTSAASWLRHDRQTLINIEERCADPVSTFVAGVALIGLLHRAGSMGGSDTDGGVGRGHGDGRGRDFPLDSISRQAWRAETVVGQE